MGASLRRLGVHDPDRLLGHPPVLDLDRINGRFVSISGHMHDVDITGPGSCTTHCAGGGQRHRGHRRGASAARPTRLLRAEPADTQRHADVAPGGPDRRDDVPLGGLLRHVVRRHPVGRAPRHGERLRDLQRRPGGAQALVYPAERARGRPRTATRSAPVSVIRLHSEYQNDTGFSQTDAMGIMVGYLSPTEPGYRAPEGGHAVLRAAGARLQRMRLDRTAPTAAPLNYPSCNPPTLTSSQADGRHARTRTAAGRELRRLGQVRGARRQRGDRRRRGGRERHRQRHRRPQEQRPDRLHGSAAAAADVRDHRPQQRAGRGRRRASAVDLADHSSRAPTTAGGRHAIGSTCSVTTSASTRSAARQRCARTGARTGRWSDVRVFDGGPDGLASSTAGNTLFAVQGVFVP